MEYSLNANLVYILPAGVDEVKNLDIAFMIISLISDSYAGDACDSAILTAKEVIYKTGLQKVTINKKVQS